MAGAWLRKIPNQMPIQLKIDEMLEVLQNLADMKAEEVSKLKKDDPGFKAAKKAETDAYDLFSHWAEQAEALANDMADVIAEELNVAHTGGEFEGMAFAGLCVGFVAKESGQPIPEAMKGLDEGGEEDWGTEEEFKAHIAEVSQAVREADQERRNRNN